MSTPTIPALLDPTQFDLTLTPGTYADLVAGTLGNTADPSDLFEADVISAALLPEGLRADALANDGDVLQAAAVTPIFDTHPARDLQAQLQPVSDAMDIDLAAFTGTVVVQPQSGTPGGAVTSGATVGQPTTVQASDFAGYTVNTTVQASVTRVGAAQQSLVLTVAAIDPQYQNFDELELLKGDARIFEPYFPVGVARGITNQPQPSVNVNVIPALPGHWWAVISLHAQFNPGPARIVGLVVDILS